MKAPPQKRRSPAGEGEAASKPKQNSTKFSAPASPLALVTKKAEPRVDSRLLAQHLGNEHKAVMALVARYTAEFRGMGILPFEKGEIVGRGQPERFALLNEDQAYFLLSLSRNTPRVVALKAKLVMTFREARHAAELHAEYLPSYRGLHDQLHTLAAGSPNERWAHVNINKLVNKAAGIESGERGRLGVPRKSIVIAVQYIAAQAMHGAADHREAYARARAALAPFMLPDCAALGAA